MIRFCFALLSAFSLFTVSVSAGIRLPAVVGNGMVLQQQARTTIWGWGDPSEKIMVTTSWNGKTDSTVTSSDGKWSIRINTPSAGGPYTISLQGWSSVTIEDVMIGEVWLCSGQSNMEWSSYNNNKQILDEMPGSYNKNIRLFHVPRTTAEYPQDNCMGSWQVCNEENLKGFSIIGYFFGKRLQQELNVPVGLIMAAWGGTPVESWTPESVIRSNPVMNDAAGKLQQTPWGPHRAGVIYNGMIVPIIPFELAGVIWYQGESNTGIASSYSTTFGAMIKTWRQLWKKNFPFYYVQIAPYDYGKNMIGPLLQEQQTKTLGVDNTGMVVITDLVADVKNIHPPDKISVSRRLANMALAKTYKKNTEPYESPRFNHLQISKGEVSLYFDYAPNGFMARDKKVTGFYIAGEDRNFLPAEVKIQANRIVIKNKSVKAPVAVRFAFTNTAQPNISSKEGLPITPFRTDDWDTVVIREEE